MLLASLAFAPRNLCLDSGLVLNRQRDNVALKSSFDWINPTVRLARDVLGRHACTEMQTRRHVEYHEAKHASIAALTLAMYSVLLINFAISCGCNPIVSNAALTWPVESLPAAVAC
jgi:hypothetical protein